mmetsp:Transcript_19324/g.46173  ORF Transcript_19324/g.46173 Transcript_19324/m.46173 type:complete len:217 (-) Transcript_19324:38-688(-)
MAPHTGHTHIAANEEHRQQLKAKVEALETRQHDTEDDEEYDHIAAELTDLTAQLDALEKQDERWLAELGRDVEDLELTGALADVANFLHDADACMRLIRKPTYTDAEAAQIATLCHTAAAAARTVKPDSNSAWLDNLDHVIPTIALWWHRVFGVGLGVFAAQAAEHFNKIAKHYLRYQSYGNASPINKLKHMMREVNWRAIHHRDFGRKKRRHSSL